MDIFYRICLLVGGVLLLSIIPLLCYLGCTYDGYAVDEIPAWDELEYELNHDPEFIKERIRRLEECQTDGDEKVENEDANDEITQERDMQNSENANADYIISPSENGNDGNSDS